MKNGRQLLWFDGLAGLAVGIVVLPISAWLAQLYNMPTSLMVINGIANLVYASYSLSLARRARRPMHLIVFLASANMAWGVLCVVVAAAYFNTASILGLGHFILEALFVGGLGFVEWRRREHLVSA